ncbi:sodium/iodide cotransporter-like [Cyanistes caeruleus]|uniref:sodium/iodide cotransporter-like n=1 Tax=Cyanistes caeruleus TaxID=156563 RepID=UPI000CDAEAB2|nr:sodium/iodide cotransporter-like [Cyanistes caeruleus]
MPYLVLDIFEGTPGGVLAGLALGLSLSLWVAIGATLYPPSAATMGVLPTSGALCPPRNVTSATSATHGTALAPEPLRPAVLGELYSVSYLYYGALGTLGTLGTGVLLSLLPGQSRCPQGVLWWDIVRAPAVPKGDNTRGDRALDTATVTRELLERPDGEGTPRCDPPEGGTVTESDV